MNGLEVAVIGIGCRFPGSNNYHQLWQNLMDGKEQVKRFSDDELIASGVTKEILKDPSFIKVKATVENSDQFDADFFNYKANDASLIEPQERIFYETVWEALEDAGCIPGQYTGAIGLYAGAFFNLYWPLQNILKNGDKARLDLNQFDDKDFICSRISYKLNLTGPSVAVQTACSTSLVAVHLACRALLTGECQVAVAGGASIKLPVKFGHIYQEGGVYSRVGHLSAFDINADGIVEGDGVGAVVLKRLEDALNDGDDIYAIIKGSSINNDGNNKVGYYSPSVSGQLEVLQQCYQLAEIDPLSLRFIECHGTGTPLGDQIEIASLKQAIRTNERQKCVLGSAKNNFGHTAAAAGILSFIKAVLSIKHKKFPPHINFTKPHPKLELQNSPFFISPESVNLNNGEFPLRGAVSSFGIGGTNAHVVLEEMGDHPSVSKPQAPHLLIFSARTQQALTLITQNFCRHLADNQNANFDDMVYTLQTGRSPFEYRAALVVDSKEEALHELNNPQSSALVSKNCTIKPRQIVFMFPGQGAQYVHMGKDLYQHEPVFNQAFEDCRKILLELAEIDIYRLLYPMNSQQADQETNAHIYAIDVSPMITFSFEYALAQLFQSMGIQPTALIGHSIGEYVAACLSGVFSLRDALQLVVFRGQLMKRTPPGMMVSIPMTISELIKIMPSNLDVAADHGASCIISGPSGAVSDFDDNLRKNKVISQVLNIEKAGHSAMMDSILSDYLACFKKILPQKPKIPFISNVTGTWIDDNNAIDPHYWVKQLRSTVQFNKGLDAVLESGKSIVMEVGPGNSLSMLAHAKKRDKDITDIIFTIKPQQQKGSDLKFLMKQIAKYWIAGGLLNWPTLHRGAFRRKISLPTYPFDRKSYNQDVSFIFDANKAGQLMQDARKPINQWFYQSAWQLSETVKQEGSQPLQDCYLVFTDQHGILDQFIRDLANKNRPVYQVKYGSEFHTDGTLFTINPQRVEDYQQLVEHLMKIPTKITKVIHGWQLSNARVCLPNQDWISTVKLLGFYSLVNFVNAYNLLDTDSQIDILAITNGLSDVQSTKPLFPEKSIIHGAIKVIPKECSNITCKTLDFPYQKISNSAEISLAVMQEITYRDSHQVICYYSGQRYVEEFVPLTFNKKASSAMRLRDQGTYVITGGLGGIGLTLAEYITTKTKANIILFSRTSLLEQQEWEAYLREHSNSLIGQKINSLQSIQKNALHLSVLQADVSNALQMKEVFDKIKLKFGKVHGVIHCAGAFDGNMLFENSQEKSEKIFSTKIDGTLILDQLMQDEPDFFIVCSSLSSHLATLGQLNYCAASVFLDYYAKYKMLNSEVFTLSINWDAWKEVGGAVKTISDLAQKMQGNTQKDVIIHHPIIKLCLSQSSSQIVFQGILESSCWIVDHHRVMGKPTMPGVAYIELIVAAFKAFNPSKTIQLNEIYLLKPLQVEEKQEIRLLFTKAGTEYNFSVLSSIPNIDIWVENARGNISAIEDKNPLNNFSIDTLKANCPIDGFLNFSKRLTEDGITKFGDQWTTCIKGYWRGKNQALIELQLAEQYLEVLKEYKLHPALFDHCMSILAEKAYVPFLYEKIHIYGELTPHLFAAITEKKSEQTDDKVITYQVSIVDNHGRLILEVDNYTLLRMDESSDEDMLVSEEPQGKPLASYIPQQQQVTSNSEFAASILIDAISCEEGKEVFARLLNANYSNLIVSTKDFNKRYEENKQELILPNQPVSEDKPRSLRPTMAVQYVEPKNQNEVKLAKIWQDLLGIDKVGLNDSFFELGANSLQVIQAAGKMKKALNVNVPIIHLYTYPTISELINHLFPVESTDRIDDESMAILDNKKRLLSRRHKLQEV